ncbi:hypothetical protein GCM10009016_20550 [Halomonas beimenensis]
MEVARAFFDSVRFCWPIIEVMLVLITDMVISFQAVEGSIGGPAAPGFQVPALRACRNGAVGRYSL